jgi:5'-nucleotidase
MPNFLDGKLVVGISSSALFNTEEAAEIYHNSGKSAFVDHQIGREEIAFEKGTAFSLIQALLKLNATQTREEQKQEDKQLVEVIIFSRTEPAAGLRAMNSVDYYGLKITRAAFVGGSPVVPYLPPYRVSLFLSNNDRDVREALKLKIAAAKVYSPPEICTIDHTKLRIAFDGDAVLFDDESERIYKKSADAFFAHEKEKARDPLNAGPFAPFLHWLQKLRSVKLPHLGTDSPVRIALVTARNSPAHKRVILTLRAWGIEVDEIFFLGGLPKEDVLKVFAPHIFFDDQENYTKPASLVVPTGHVPFGIKNEQIPETIRPEPRTTLVVPSNPEPVLTIDVPELTPVIAINEDAFEAACRAIFRSYTPMAGTKKNVILEPRFRDFILKNKKRKPEERGRIIQNLSRYDLGGIHSHEPMLNRELESMVGRKLEIISEESAKQQNLKLI